MSTLVTLIMEILGGVVQNNIFIILASNLGKSIGLNCRCQDTMGHFKVGANSSVHFEQ
jgi:hypothetical protein